MARNKGNQEPNKPDLDLHPVATKAQQRKVGRPSAMTAHVLMELKQAFLNGANDNEACAVAGISPRVLYRYQEEHPEYVEQKEAWKEDILYRARLNISKAVKEGDTELSQWLLSRKRREEFGEESKSVVNIGIDMSGLLDKLANDLPQLPENTRE